MFDQIRQARHKRRELRLDQMQVVVDELWADLLNATSAVLTASPSPEPSVWAYRSQQMWADHRVARHRWLSTRSALRSVSGRMPSEQESRYLALTEEFLTLAAYHRQMCEYMAGVIQAETPAIGMMKLRAAATAVLTRD